MLHWLTPSWFQRFARRAVAPLGMLAALTLCTGLYFALRASPPDYQQGESVRIMYVHVPAAWMSLLIYSFMAACSVGFLAWKNPLTSLLAQQAAVIGTGFAFVTLLTGSLWGKPIWGAWWVWDARLTSMLLLFFLYAGYLAVANAYERPERGAQAAAILCIVGVVNLPIIKFSVEWWNTLHQPASLLKRDGPAIHPEMLVPLLLMFGGFVLLAAFIVCIRAQSALLERKIAAAQHRLSL